MQTLGVCVTGVDLTIGEYHFDQLLRNEWRKSCNRRSCHIRSCVERSCDEWSCGNTKGCFWANEEGHVLNHQP